MKQFKQVLTLTIIATFLVSCNSPERSCKHYFIFNQAIILILGSIIITYLGLQEVGGWAELRNTVVARN